MNIETKYDQNVKKMEEYNEKLEYCKSGCAGFAEKRVKIGNYELSRLHRVEDIYNNAYIEENYSYIFNKDGVPFKVCETFAGNANLESSSLSEIEKNAQILEGLVSILVFIDFSKKLPYSLKYGKFGKELEGFIDDCITNNDYSQIASLVNEDKSTFDKMIKKFTNKLEKEEKSTFNYTIMPRLYKTREEVYGREM